MGKITRIYAEREPDVRDPSGQLLVVEDDADARKLWAEVLTDAGYLSRVVDSLGDALLLAEVETYDLALIDLYAGPKVTGLTPAHILRRRVAPTPVGLLLTAPAVSPEWDRRNPFAFVQALPCDVDVLLVNIAAAIDRLFIPARRWQQQLVLRFMEALGNEDWPSAPALFCTEDVTFLSPDDAPFTWSARPPIAGDLPAVAARDRPEIHGREAFSTYLRTAATYQRRLTCFDLHSYPLARGVAARFTCTYETPDGLRHRETGSLIFHFSHGCISRIGSRAVTRRPARITAGTGDAFGGAG